MRLLAVVLTAMWAVTAIVIANAFRPGGPVDIVVALACFVPVVIADAGVIWPPRTRQGRARVALAWVWITAMLFTTPLLYNLASTLASDGPQSLLPSAETVYAIVIALYFSSFFSIVGLIHRRRGVRSLERRATWLAALVAGLLTVVAGAAFLLVAAVNEHDLRQEEPASSRYGPTDPDLEPPYCDEQLALGPNAHIVVTAISSLDTEVRGTARLEGQRNGLDEAWSGSWSGPDGEGGSAYRRVGRLAWRNDLNDDQAAPGSTWQRTEPDPYDLLGTQGLTLDGPPYAVASAPRGAIVAEDLGIDHIEGARARHCRTFIDGDTALHAFLPLRWLLYDSSEDPGSAIPRWRGELDWWVFADGQLGRATVEVSGSRAETPWDAEGVRVVLGAELSATDRDGAMAAAARSAAAAAARSAAAAALVGGGGSSTLIGSGAIDRAADGAGGIAHASAIGQPFASGRPFAPGIGATV